jgi:hypothetical protein
MRYNYAIYTVTSPMTIYESMNVPRSISETVERYGVGTADIMVFDHNARRVARVLKNIDGIWQKVKLSDEERAAFYRNLTPPRSEIGVNEVPVSSRKKELLFQWKEGRNCWAAFCDGYLYRIVPAGYRDLTEEPKKEGPCTLKVCFNYHADFYTMRFKQYDKAEDAAQAMYYKNLEDRGFEL